MEMTERMDGGVRDHECANEHVPRRVKEGRKKGETRWSLDSPDALFGAVSLGESSRATIREFEWRCLT